MDGADTKVASQSCTRPRPPYKAASSTAASSTRATSTPGRRLQHKTTQAATTARLAKNTWGRAAATKWSQQVPNRDQMDEPKGGKGRHFRRTNSSHNHCRHYGKCQVQKTANNKHQQADHQEWLVLGLRSCAGPSRTIPQGCRVLL